MADDDEEVKSWRSGGGTPNPLLRRGTMMLTADGGLTSPEHGSTQHHDDEDCEEEGRKYRKSMGGRTHGSDSDSESDEEDYITSAAEAKEAATASAQEKGEKALSYIQQMLKNNEAVNKLSRNRRSIDYDAMPKSEMENKLIDQVKRFAREDRERQKEWYDKLDDIKEVCPDLVEYLRDKNVNDNSINRACRAACRFFSHQVADWSLAKSVYFVGTLGFPEDDVDRYRKNLRFANGTGKYLLVTQTVDKYLDLGFRPEHGAVMVGINKSWRNEFQVKNRPGDEKDPGVYVPDYAALEKANRMADETGYGQIYGQLVALGHKEYIAKKVEGLVALGHKEYIAKKVEGYEGQLLHPQGERNECFVLERRGTANGIRKDAVVMRKEAGGELSNIMATHRVTMAVNHPKRSREERYTIVTEYIPDDALDMFQLGRLMVKQNDIVVRGPLTSNEKGQYCGPVSRYAARIMCSRLPPFTCYLCAAGFDSKQEIFLNESAPKWRTKENDDWDAVTTFGLRMWQPSVNRWVEVSVNGYMHEIRPNDSVAGERIGHKMLAKLEHGSIIDMSGVQLIWQDFQHMKLNKPSEVTLQEFFGDFNKLRLQCPVELQTIRYSRSMMSGKLKSTGEDWKDDGKEDDDEDWSAGVFPACGHVVTFNEDMERGLLCCPLCRSESRLKKLSISFTPAVTYADTTPTHVFNPCGCAASLRACRFWSQIKIKHPPTPGYTDVSICPFCATNLDEEKMFSRIITGHEVKIGVEGGVIGVQSKLE